MNNDNNPNSMHQNLEQGKKYLQRGEYSRSLVALKNVLLNDPFCEEAVALAEKAMNAITHLEAQIIAVTFRSVRPSAEKQGPDRTPARTDRASGTLKKEQVSMADKTQIRREDVTQKQPAKVETPGSQITNSGKDEAPDIDNMFDSLMVTGKRESKTPAPKQDKPGEQAPTGNDIFNKGFQAYRQGKLTQAYDLFISVLKKTPLHKEAQRYCKITREVLRKKYIEELGSLDGIPVLQNVGQADIRNLALTSKEGFLLSRIDGYTSFKHLFYLSQMDAFDTGRFFVTLLENGLLKIK